jgi:hypothetical protein
MTAGQAAGEAPLALGRIITVDASPRRSVPFPSDRVSVPA